MPLSGRRIAVLASLTHAGEPSPLARRNTRILIAETLTPSSASSPRILRHPHLGFSPIRGMSARASSLTHGLPPAEVRLSPLPSYQLPVPPKERLWAHHERRPPSSRDDPADRGHEQSVATVKTRPAHLALQDLRRWRRTTTSTSLVRSLGESETSRNRRRRNRYANAKSTDQTSDENEARSYECAASSGDRRFLCPSGRPPPD